jgi:hypothetical protein
MERNLLTIFVSALVVVVSFGCAQVDYPCITDELQAGDANGTVYVETQGKAHIAEFMQIGVILGDGSVHEITNFLNQSKNPMAPNGVESVLTNYDHSAPSQAEFVFHSDQYCNDDAEGCSAATNTDNAFCGDGKGGITIGSGPCADGLGLLFGDSIRDNECGRAAVTDPVPQLAGLTLLEATNLITSNGTLVDGAYEMSLGPAVTFHYDGASYPVALPTIPARVTLAPGFKFQVLVDLSGPAFASVLYDLQDIADANPGSRFTISAEIFGQTLNLSGSFRLIDSELVPGFYAEKASRLWGV